MRDWLATLWPASFKGTPFWAEKDEEGGGRRIVVHQFPHRDDPFLEDLGEDKRAFDVEAYVASDDADGEAQALVATCAGGGAGTLVLPTHGAITVQCLTFKRSREKDRAGKIAFTLSFIRDGADTALVSVASLANLGFEALDAVAAAATSVTSATVTTSGHPDFVTQGASAAVQDAAATFEAIRLTEPVDPAASTAVGAAIQALYDNASADPAGVAGGAAAMFVIARSLGDGLSAEAAQRAFAAVLDAPAPSTAIRVPTPAARAAATNAAAVYRALRLAALTAWLDALLRAEFRDRPAGLSARAAVAERIEAELNDATGAANAELFVALQQVRDRTVEYLSRLITDLAPVLTVEANLSMPSLFWAWRIYQDPTRAAELVQRNRVKVPSLMPTSFEALAR